MFSPTCSGTVARTALAAVALAGAALATAPIASAATIEKSISYGFYPAEYDWDGGGVQAPAEKVDEGYYTGSASQLVTEADTLVPGYAPPATGLCGVEDADVGGQIVKVPSFYCFGPDQVRGGNVIEFYDKNLKSIPVRLVPGDVIRLTNPTDKTTLVETTVVAPEPVISSVIGSTDVTIGRRSDATDIYVGLLRRVPRNVKREVFVPGTYRWVAGAPGTGTTACTGYVWDAQTRDLSPITDTLPPAPTVAPPAGQAWILQRLTECKVKDVAIPGAPFETISQGRIVAAAENSYTARFATPLQPGDLLWYSEASVTSAGDVETTISRANVARVGVVPPPDKAAPKVTKFDLGAANTSIKSFLKFGLATFVTLDEPGTVNQQLILPAEKPKKKKGKKKPKAKAPVVLATGSAKTTAPGETAKVLLTASKDGRKALKKIKKGKPAKAKLVTTVVDGAGNAFTSESELKLSGK